MDNTHLQQNFFSPLERAQEETGLRLRLFGSTASRIAIYEALDIVRVVRKSSDEPYTLFDYCPLHSDINIEHNGPQSASRLVIAALERYMPYFDYFRWSVTSFPGLMMGVRRQAFFASAIPVRQVTYDTSFDRTDQIDILADLHAEFIPPAEAPTAFRGLHGPKGMVTDLPATSALIYAHHLLDLARFHITDLDEVIDRLLNEPGIRDTLKQSRNLISSRSSPVSATAMLRLKEKCAALIASGGQNLQGRLQEDYRWSSLFRSLGLQSQTAQKPYFHTPARVILEPEAVHLALSEGNAEDRFTSMLIEEAIETGEETPALAPNQTILASIENVRIHDAGDPFDGAHVGRDIFSCTISTEGHSLTSAEEDLSAVVFIETKKGRVPLHVTAVCFYSHDRTLLTIRVNLAEILPGENTLHIYLVGLSTEKEETGDHTRYTELTGAEETLLALGEDEAVEEKEAYEASVQRRVTVEI